MGSAVKSLLAVYRLQGGRASSPCANFAHGLEVVPTALASRSPASIAAEPARSIGNHLIRVEPRKGLTLTPHP